MSVHRQFYTSVRLLGDLLNKGTNCVGTTRSNRKHFPSDLIPTKDYDKATPGNFRFAIGTCVRSSGTTIVMEADELSVGYAATICPVEAPPKVSVNVTTGSQAFEATVGQGDDQGDSQGKISACQSSGQGKDDKIIALWWRDCRDVWL